MKDLFVIQTIMWLIIISYGLLLYLYDIFMVLLHTFLKVSKLLSKFFVIARKRATRTLFKFLLLCSIEQRKSHTGLQQLVCK